MHETYVSQIMILELNSDRWHLDRLLVLIVAAHDQVDPRLAFQIHLCYLCCQQAVSGSNSVHHLIVSLVARSFVAVFAIKTRTTWTKSLSTGCA